MRQYFSASLIVVALALPVCVTAQSDQDQSLGDVARSYRKEKKAPDRTVISNENLDQIMDEIQEKKFTSSLLFSFDNKAKDFTVSSPDVTCSLSFNAKSTSLISDPFRPRDLPGDELVKLDGPAVIHGNTLEVSIFNGSEWNLREVTVGITTLRMPPPNSYGPPLLKPAAEKIVEAPAERRSDQTVLYRMKGNAVPQSTTVFTAELTSELGSDQEWHWAIVGAKGTPTEPPATNMTTLPSDPLAEPAPATSKDSPHP
jgi:hypothetical protein